MSNRRCMGCMKEYDDRFDVCPHCGYIYGTPAEKPFHMAPGSILHDKYIVGKVLGFGGFGVTYVGWDYEMERKLAIKEYLPGEFATRSVPTEMHITVYGGEKTEQFNAGLAKTIDEAKRLARFENIPGIVQVYDCFEDNGTTYIIMEYLEGCTVKTYLKEHGKMTPEQALPVTMQIAEAMKAVHKTGMLHRDIAPDNIQILNPEDEVFQVKLFDFGAARYATTSHSKSLSVILKPGYAPEEQYRSRGDQGTWTDVYALGATLYKMLTGVTPPDAMERAVKDELKRPSKLGVRISKAEENALLNALHVRQQDRTQTMEDFSNELLAAEVKEREITRIKKDVGAVPKWIFAVSALLLCLVIGLGVMIATGTISTVQRTGDSKLEKAETRVPNLIGDERTEAETKLSRQNLRIKYDSVVYSEEIPMDHISFQSVKENATVQIHTDIRVQVSAGEQKFVFPDVRGETREGALAKLLEAGFREANIEWRSDKSANADYGQITETEPAANTLAARSQHIVITISANENRRKIEVSVPNVRGLLLDEAKRVLRKKGLNVKEVPVKDNPEPDGTVLYQNVQPGGSAYEGDYITLEYSDWSIVFVTVGVENETEDAAWAKLESMGLIVDKSLQEASEKVDAGRVIRVISKKTGKQLAENDTLHRNDEVQMVISTGSAVRQEAVKQTAAAQQSSAQQAAAERAAAERAAAERAAQQAAAQQAAAQQAAAQQAAAQQAAAQQAAQQAAAQQAAAERAAAEQAAQQAAAQAAEQNSGGFDPFSAFGNIR